MKKKNTIPGVSDAVVMAAFRRGVKDPDLLKKLSRRQPEMVKDLFDMADLYASEEEAMVAKETTWWRQLSTAESSKHHARTRRRTQPSPPNKRITSAKETTWWR